MTYNDIITAIANERWLSVQLTVYLSNWRFPIDHSKIQPKRTSTRDLAAILQYLLQMRYWDITDAMLQRRRDAKKLTDAMLDAMVMLASDAIDADAASTAWPMYESSRRGAVDDLSEPLTADRSNTTLQTSSTFPTPHILLTSMPSHIWSFPRSRNSQRESKSMRISSSNLHLQRRCQVVHRQRHKKKARGGKQGWGGY